MLVSALIRCVQDAGGSAAVLARGDATAGGILLLAYERGAHPRFLERGIGPSGNPALIAAARPRSPTNPRFRAIGSGAACTIPIFGSSNWISHGQNGSSPKRWVLVDWQGLGADRPATDNSVVPVEVRSRTVTQSGGSPAAR
ncbi:MAG: DUF1491 family protein [Sphingomonas sp.]